MMPPQANDRRVQRTRQLLRDALLDLIVERGYEDLTVQHILDRANLGRATFYAHYRDKQDLLLDAFSGLQHVFAEPEHGAAPGAGLVRQIELLSLRFFRHAAEQHRLYRAMVGKQSGAMLHTYAHQLLSDQLRKHLAQLAPRGAPPQIPVEVAVTYLVSALLALLSWWLDQGMPYPPEQIDAMFRRLALPGLAAAFGFGDAH